MEREKGGGREAWGMEGGGREAWGMEGGGEEGGMGGTVEMISKTQIFALSLGIQLAAVFPAHVAWLHSPLPHKVGPVTHQLCLSA